MSDDMKKQLTIVGRMAHVDVFRKEYTNIPAKIDTGADASSIDACNVHVTKDGILHYTLLNPRSPYFMDTAKTTTDFTVKLIRSSTGHEQIRYAVKLPIRIKDRRFIATFTLSNRERNYFPILIGSKLLKGKFAVDVSEDYATYRAFIGNNDDPEAIGSRYLTKMSNEDAYEFYKQHYFDQGL